MFTRRQALLGLGAGVLLPSSAMGALVGPNRALLVKKQQSLVSLLFGNGENGCLFYPATDLTRLFTTSSGPTNVAVNNNPDGLWLDNHSWNGLSLTGQLAGATELRGTGTVNKVGSATDATYNTSTGAGTVNRVDLSNQSFVQISGLTIGATYAVDLECVSSTILCRVGSQTGTAQMTVTNGRATAYIVPTTILIYFTAASASSPSFTIYSVKRLTGNHALNATAGQRPTYKTNSGRPYLDFDGANSRLVSPFIPTANGTLAAAFYPTAVSGAAMGGGATTGNKRAIIGVDTGGGFAYGLGDQTTFAGSTTSILNAPHVAVMTWQGLSGAVYLDGTLFANISMGAGPDGTGGGLALGAYNNNGSAATLLTGRVYAAAATNDQLNASEIAQLTRAFQLTMQ